MDNAGKDNTRRPGPNDTSVAVDQAFADQRFQSDPARQSDTSETLGDRALDESLHADSNEQGSMHEKVKSADTETDSEQKDIPRQLRIEPAELEFMKGVAQFVGTSPRRVKRFVNIYRLLKASVPTHELASFFVVGSDSEEYQAAIVLLAVLTGSPILAPRVLHEIAIADAYGTVEGFKVRFMENEEKSDDADHNRVAAILEYYQRKKGSQVTLTDLKRWAPIVARYSFRAHA